MLTSGRAPATAVVQSRVWCGSRFGVEQRAQLQSKGGDLLWAGARRGGLCWQRAQAAAMELNCVQLSDGAWYGVCHVGPNDI